MREAFETDSPKVAMLRRGDVVLQDGPPKERRDGLVRMPVFLPDGDGGGTRGWVSVDARNLNGPVVLEPVDDEAH